MQLSRMHNSGLTVGQESQPIDKWGDINDQAAEQGSSNSSSSGGR